jgi:hypothetical protein
MLDKTEPRPVDRREDIQIHQYGDYEHQTQVVEDNNQGRRLVVGRVAQLIWLAFGVLISLLGLRFLLKLIAANPANPFANLVYDFTDLFLWPFWGIAGTPSVEGMVLEIPVIIAILVFALAGWVIVRLVWLLFYMPSSRTVRTVEHDRDYPLN